MAAIEQYMDNFGSNVQNGNYTSLEYQLDNFSRQFEKISSSDIVSAIETILDEETGFIRFLKSELAKYNYNISKNAISKVFDNLTFLIEKEELRNSLEKYGSKIMDCCGEAIGKSKLDQYVKNSALGTLRALLENIDNFETNRDAVDRLNRQIISCRGKAEFANDLEKIVSALCIIAKTRQNFGFPTDTQKNAYKRDILKILTELSTSMKDMSSKQQLRLINCNFQLKLLSDFLKILDIDKHINDNERQTLYKNLKDVFHYQLEFMLKGVKHNRAQNNEIKKNVINIIIQHRELFKDMMMLDFYYWDDKLKYISPYVGQTAKNGLKTLYDIMSDSLKGNEQRYKKMKEELMPKDDEEYFDLKIYAYGKLAECCKLYETEQEVTLMYNRIAQKINAFFEQANENEEKFALVPNCLKILSDVVRFVKNPSVVHLSVPIKIDITLLKRFPDCNSSLQSEIIKSIKETIVNISQLTPILFKKFLHDTVYEGVLWTCSHTLRIDEKLHRKLNENENIITYQNYIPLWNKLICDVNISDSIEYANERLHVKVFEEVIKSYKIFLSKLNLQTKVEENSLNNVTVRIPVNDDDFRIFINLSEFYVELIEFSDEDILANLIYEFLYEVMKKSYSDPTISAHFKVINAVFKKIDLSYWTSSESGKEKIFDLVSQYISHMLDEVTKLLREPQIACISMLLSTPFTEALITEIPAFIERTVPVFQLALTIGTGDLDLAFDALESLEKWVENPQNQSLEELLRKVLPHLELYLHSTESLAEMSPDIIKEQRKIVKTVTIINDENSLENFQRRVLLLFGSIVSDITKDYLYEKSLDTGASWHQRKEFIYNLPLEDLTVEINLVKILPRTIDLAVNSGDRQTKVAACEVLHALIVMILGSHKENFYFDKTLCTAILKLGSETDNVCLQMFRPFALQLMNCLSSKNNLTNDAANNMLETIFDGLADEHSTFDFKEFCGICLKNFINSSETTSEDLEKTPVGCKMLVEKLHHFALHPAESKRIAAAVIFNNLFQDPEKVDHEFNKYLYRLLFCFVKSLDKCNDWRIVEATQLMEQILKVKSNLLNEDLGIDEVPADFEGKTLKSAVTWLLQQSSSVPKNQRKRCMEMVEELAPLVEDCGSMQTFMQNYLTEKGLGSVHKICLKELDTDFELNIANLNLIISSLDCYKWILDKDFLQFDKLFSDERTIFDAILMCSLKLVDYAEDQPDVKMSLKELKDFNTAISESALKIISFVTLCLEKHKNDPSFAAEDCWTVTFKLIRTALLLPSSLKFNVDNLVNIEMLRSELCKVLCAIKSTRNGDLLDLFYNTLENSELLELIWDLQDNENSIRFQNEILYGCTLLHETEILDKTERGRAIIEGSEEKLKECFNVVESESDSSGNDCYSNVDLDGETLYYYTYFMNIYLYEGEEPQIKCLLRLVLGRHSTRESQFITKFQVPILSGLLRNVPNTISVLDELLHENQHTDEIFSLIENLAVFAYENKQVSVHAKRELADKLISKHRDYELLGFGSRKENFINIYKFAVKLLKDPFEVSTNAHYKSFKDWITEEFTKSRLKIIESFLSCLINSSETDSNYLSIILGDKKSESEPEMISYFEALSKMLPVTKSSELLKSMINYSAGSCDQLFSKTTEKYLADYISNIPLDDVLKSLNIVYDSFKIWKERIVRFDIFNKYLWLLLNYLLLNNSQREAVKLFYVMNINDIYKIIDQSFSDKNDENEQLAISKMMCFKLLGNMLSNFGKDANSDFSKEVSKKLGLENGMTFVKKCLGYAKNIRSLKIENLDGEIERLLNCHAYNCYLVLCTITKNKDDLILGFMHEGRCNIWNKLIDEKELTLPETSQKQPKIRKEFINLRRKKESCQVVTQPYSFLHVYDLNTSTLREDINTFDFNEKQPVTYVQDSQDNNVVEYKCTDYNDHECMQTIGEFYETLVQQGIINLSDPTPKGFIQIISKSLVQAKADNVKLFLYRLIINSGRIFGPFMKHIMWNIFASINIYLEKHKMNYLITDMLKFVIKSVNEEDVVPKEGRHMELSQKLINKIISQIERTDLNPSTLRMYEELLKSFVSCWQKSVTLSPNFILERFEFLEKKVTLTEDVRTKVIRLVSVILQFLSYRETKVKLLQQFESNPNVPDLKKILFEISRKYSFGLDNLVRQIFEALGQILDEDDIDEYNLTPVLHNLKNLNLLIKCVYSLCRSNKKLGKNYCDLTIFDSKITDESQQRRIMIHTLLVDELSEVNMMSNLQYINFTTLMKNLGNCAAAGLELICALAARIGPKNLIPLAEIAYSFKDNDDKNLRKSVYETFVKILSRFHESDDEESQKLMQMCTRILIQGLEDSSEDLSEMVCKFWTEEYGLPDSFIFRFLKLLDIYAPEVDKYYLLFLCIAMFGLVRKSSCDERVNKEDKLKEEDSHRPYPIQIDGWSKSLINRTPLYVRTSASFVSQYYKCSDICTMRDVLTNESYIQSVSQTLNPTASTSRMKISDGRDNVFNIEKVFESTEERTKDFYKSRENQKNKRRSRDLQEEAVRRKNEVSVVRTYRIGNFETSYPDISLTHGEVVRSLIKLIKKDPTSCKTIFISFILGLFDYYEKTSRTEIKDFKQKVSSKIDFILENGQNTSPIINALLEFLFCSDLKYKGETIARITKLNGVTEVGILLLEKKLLEGNEESEPPVKRSRDEFFVSSEDKTWIQLAGLYNSLKNVDIVLSIFSKHVSGADLQEASFARIANDWKKAALSYEKAAQNKILSVHEHCLEGMYECYSQLSNWAKIDNSIKKEVKNLDTIWDQKSWITPWIFRTKLALMLNDEHDDEFSHKLETWMKSKPREQQIKRLYGEELAMFYIDDKSKHTKLKDCIKLNLNHLREQWTLISTLSAQLRIAKLSKLHGLSEIKAFLKVYSPDDSEREKRMIERWSQITPSDNDDYSYWSTHVAYRLHFSDIFTEGNKSEEMVASDINHLRKLLHVAIDHKNKDVAKQNFHKLGKYFSRIDLDVIDNRLNFDKAAYKKMCAELDPSNCIDYYNEAGMYAKIGLSRADETLNNFRQLSASILLALSDIIESDPSKLNEISSSIRKDLVEVDRAKEYFVATAFDSLDKCTRESKDQEQQGQSQFTIAQYCYSRICNDKLLDVNLVKKFVESTLKAMNYNVDHATRYFPCLLNEAYLVNEEIRDTFVSLCESMESWRFLPWQAQIISFLDKPIGSAVIPIMDRMINDYPNAVLHNFKLAVDLSPELRQTESIVRIYTRITEERKDFWKFQEAMKMVVKPNVLLMQKLSTAIRRLSAGESAENMKAEFEARQLAENNVKWNERYSTIRMYEREILKALDENSIRKLDVIYNRIKNSETRARGERSLSYYSSWLANYSGGDFEVPGQYKGDRKPTPKYHAKITRLDPNVEVMFSKCCPIKITMLGNDGKSYSFLAKSGDDLRLDQRIQQVLSFMNKTLRTDAVCRQRNLSIHTYEVIPFDITFGLIEWISGTKTLRNFVNDDVSNVANNYKTWMREGSNCNPTNNVQIYKTALRRTSNEVVEKMKELLSKIKEDSIKRTFLQLSPSLECFVTLRHTFTITYATMSLAHWILGIGDRHLKNTLVQVKSGKSIGIDYGLAFGAGLAIGVPELMPFRLTSQILGVLKPFSEHDLLALTMVNVLKALKNDKTSLIACMNIFVNESLDWEEYIRKKAVEGQEVDLNEKVEWSPKNKIEVVEKKLNGENPAQVTLFELQDNSVHSSDHFEIYSDIIKGNNSNAVRCKGKSPLNPEEQVACLLDQATDLNILGRTYEGWEPWL